MALNIVESTATISLISDTVTPPIGTKGLEVISVQAVWSGLTALDATMIIEASNNGSSWNTLDADKNMIVMDTAADTQIWNITQLQNNFVRLRYVANANTGGSAIVSFVGRGQR